METIKNIRNDLLKRKEISFILESHKNPGFEGTRKVIADDFKGNEESIDVYSVKGSFGSNKFKVNAYIYDSKEDLEKAKQLTQKQRKEMEKTKKDSEQISESVSEENKKEEKVEKPKEPEKIEKTEESDKEEQVSEVKSEA